MTRHGIQLGSLLFELSFSSYQVSFPQFDYCDQSRHFANQVVQAASKHRIIFYAITAVSARHLAILKKWDPLAADRYQAKCLQHFIPALANRDPALEGDFLCAVTLILRLYDEMTGRPPDP
jgi:hypothetical protein